MSQRIEIGVLLLITGSLVCLAHGDRPVIPPAAESPVRRNVEPAEIEEFVTAAPKKQADEKGGDPSVAERWKEFAKWRKGKPALLLDTREKRFDFACQTFEDQTAILAYADELDGKPFDPDAPTPHSKTLTRFARFYNPEVILRIITGAPDYAGRNQFLKALDPPPDRIEQIQLEFAAHRLELSNLEYHTKLGRKIRQQGVAALTKTDLEYVMTRRALFGLY